MFGFGNELNSYWRSLIRIVYPARCVFCETPLLLRETHLCLPCTRKIEPLKSPACTRCARPIPPYEHRGSLCAECRSERPYFDRGFALVSYQESIKELLHHVKFHKKLWLLSVFSKLMRHSTVAGELHRYDLMMPVPLDWWHERERGFNQAQLVAQMLKRSNPDAKVQISQALKKKKRTSPQSKLRRDERLENLKGAFRLKNQNAIRGKRVLLIDDIFTTGSTINECAKLLKDHGAERVDFFTIARS